MSVCVCVVEGKQEILYTEKWWNWLRSRRDHFSTEISNVQMNKRYSSSGHQVEIN